MVTRRTNALEFIPLKTVQPDVRYYDQILGRIVQDIHSKDLNIVGSYPSHFKGEFNDPMILPVLISLTTGLRVEVFQFDTACRGNHGCRQHIKLMEINLDPNQWRLLSPKIKITVTELE